MPGVRLNFPPLVFREPNISSLHPGQVLPGRLLGSVRTPGGLGSRRQGWMGQDAEQTPRPREAHLSARVLQAQRPEQEGGGQGSREAQAQGPDSRGSHGRVQGKAASG